MQSEDNLMFIVGQLIFKIVIAGDGGVGKSTIRKRFVFNTYQERYNMTIGSEFSVKDFSVNLGDNDKSIKLSIVDLGGQPHFKTLRKLFYKGISGALLVFDLTNKNSMLNIENWIQEIFDSVGRVPIVVAGNKEDLSKLMAESFIQREEVDVFMDHLRKKFNLEIPYFETSARTGKGIYEALAELAKLIIKKMGESQQVQQKQVLKL